MKERARLIVKKSDYQVGAARQHEDAWWHASEHGMRSSATAEEGSYLIHLTHVANSFVPAAAGSARSHSSDVRHIVHDDAAVHALLLVQPNVEKWFLAARRHTVDAQKEQVNAA